MNTRSHKRETVPPRPEDVAEAVYFINDSYERDLHVDRLRFVKMTKMPPEDFVDDRAHLGRDARGWLKEYPRSEWLTELKSAYSRDFSHILDYHDCGRMPPGIQIDGEMGDGRGRACFHWAMGLKTMPVAVYKSV